MRFDLGSALRRYLAFLIDTGVVFTGALALGLPFSGFLAAPFFLIGSLAYFPLMERLRLRATVGKIVQGRRVIDAPGGPRWVPWVLIRVFGKVLATIPPLGVVWSAYSGMFAHKEGGVGENQVMAMTNDATMFYLLLCVVSVLIIAVSPRDRADDEVGAIGPNWLDHWTGTRIVRAEEE